MKREKRKEKENKSVTEGKNKMSKDGMLDKNEHTERDWMREGNV